MMPASNRLAGMCLAMPDICLTPVAMVPVPIPYPNIGMNMMGVRFAMTVLICAGNAFNLGSMLAMSMGDAPGVLHWTIMGTVTYTMGCPKVLIECLPGCSLLSPTVQNKTNAVGMQIVPSATNVFYMYDGGATSVDMSDIDAVERATRDTDAVLDIDLGADFIAMLRIHVFSDGVPSRVYAALAKAQARGARALMVDLRGNPGGDVMAAIDVAGEFLPAGTIIATLVDADGDETQYRSCIERPCELPLTILVDEHTASAAELFAGALQAHGRAVVVGNTTVGKGTVQTFAPSLSGLTYATVARVVLPDGTEIQGAGIRPDMPAVNDL